MQQAVDITGMKLDPVFYIIDLETAAQVPAGSVDQRLYTVGNRDFIWTHIGFTSEGVAFPGGAGMPFKVEMEDVGTGTPFQPHRWDPTRLIGTNPQTGDKPAWELPARWCFRAQTTIRIYFENTGALACTPGIQLVGYLDKVGKA